MNAIGVRAASSVTSAGSSQASTVGHPRRRPGAQGRRAEARQDRDRGQEQHAPAGRDADGAQQRHGLEQPAVQRQRRAEGERDAEDADGHEHAHAAAIAAARGDADHGEGQRGEAGEQHGAAGEERARSTARSAAGRRWPGSRATTAPYCAASASVRSNPTSRLTSQYCASTGARQSAASPAPALNRLQVRTGSRRHSANRAPTPTTTAAATNVELIDRGQADQDQPGGQQSRVAPAGARDQAVGAEEHDRDELGVQRLQVGEAREQVGVEGERAPRHRPGRRVAGPAGDQPPHRPRAQREAGQGQQVVGGGGRQAGGAEWNRHPLASSGSE